MNKEKKKRLEAKGWKVGTLEEFLGLSEEESKYVEIMLKLSQSLQRTAPGPQAFSNRIREENQIESIQGGENGEWRPIAHRKHSGRS